MDVQDHTISTTPSGHEGHDVHLCHRCGWPFPKPHPSARHRRAHKKICGTIEGYTTLIDSGVVSDDEDSEKTPSPNTEKKNIITGSAGAVGFRGRSGRSEEDLFSDAVTEFADSGTSPGTKEVIDSSIEIGKTDDSTRVSETLDAGVEKTEEIEAKGGLPEADGLDFPTDKVEKIQPSGISSVGPVSIIGEDKDAEIQDLETGKTVTESGDSGVGAEVSGITGEDGNGEKGRSGEVSDVAVGEKVEEYLKIESDHVCAPEDVKESGIDQTIDGIGEIKHETIRSEMDQSAEGISEIKRQPIESDHDCVSEVVKESEIDRISEEIKNAESESDHEHASEVVKESGIKHEKFESDQEQAPEVVEKPETDHGVSVLTEKEVLVAPESEKPEGLEEPNLVLTEKVDRGAPEFDKCSEEHTQVVLKEPDSVLTGRADLDAHELEKRTKDQAQEDTEMPNSVLTEKVDLDEHDSVLTETKNLDATDLDKHVKVQTPEATEEPKTDNGSKVVAEGVGDHSEKPSELVSKPIVEESFQKPMNNQDSGVDLSADSSSHNSVEGNWGSVSVLSTASIDDKSKPDPGKPVAADGHSGSSDVFEPPSFMTLVEPKGDTTDQKPSAAVQQPNPEEPQAGWFPTLTNVSNESEGRKRNEEVIAKVTNWSTGKQQSTPLKNLLGEAKSPVSKPPPATVAQKDEGPVNHDSSPPKLIENGKKVRKKSWVPFVCCSSVNVVK